MANKLRLGIIGTGNIGQTYIRLLQDGLVEHVELAAVSSRTQQTHFEVPHFTDYRALLDSELIDAVLIATPTMLHPEMWQAACERGLHVLVEKPLAMSVAQAESMVARASNTTKHAVMLNQRFHPHYAKLHELLASGAIGKITRFLWTMTAWYRPDIYYQVSDWRGTWPGEGGGLLINQCIHNLDIVQWLVGLPIRVEATAGFGKYHTIDVEDEFSATLQYANGATGVIVASSGEAPGINQLDIVGDRGMLRFDGEELRLTQSQHSVEQHCRETSDMFGMPEFETQKVSIAQGQSSNQHVHVLQNFVDACIDGKALLTPAQEGLGSLQLANGILLSAWRREPVDLPLDAEHYEKLLQERIAASSLRTPVKREANIDMDKSFK